MRNEKGFTLVEMLIVLLIISVLILVTVPNVTKHFKTIDNKGCDAYKSMVQSQVEAYKIDHHEYPKIEDLIAKGYLPTKEQEAGEGTNVNAGGAKCPNGEPIYITKDGKVEMKDNAGNASATQ